MRTILPLLLALPVLTGCTVETSSFYAPIRIEQASDTPRFIVILDLNGARECRVVPEDSVFPATFSVAFGPAVERLADRWARENCQRVARSDG